ncbi:MAG: hypothetical protein K6T99_06340, partial [Armatimonadetes bacterium]|nr:hypothetical protein [Armatimonadota bacterium]
MNKKAAKCRPTIFQDFNKAERKVIVLGIAAIVIMIAVAYIPAMQGGYIWDDDVYVTENTLLT